MPDDQFKGDKDRQKANQVSFRKIAIPSLVIGGAADGLSTHHALKQPGLQEGNPLYGKNPSGGRIGLIKGASAVSQLLLLDRLAKTKPKLAKGIAIGMGVLQAGVAANNMRLANKHGKK